MLQNIRVAAQILHNALGYKESIDVSEANACVMMVGDGTRADVSKQKS